MVEPLCSAAALPAHAVAASAPCTRGSASVRIACIGIAGLTLLTLAHAALGAEPRWQTPDSVRAAAETFARAFVGRPNAAVEAIAVDDRLRLPRCDAPLAASAAGAFNAGRGTVVVECTGANAWRLFVPVRLSHNVPVIVARRALHRGQVLATDDLAIVERPAAALPYEYITSLDAAVGMTLRRSLPEGTVVVPAAVDRPQMVERGARVTLVGGAGPVQVRSEGVALNRAGLGERVRVETRSGRVVEGRAEAPDQVRIGS